MEDLCLTNHISPLAYQSMYNDYLYDKIHNEQSLNAMINKQLIMTESTTLAQKERKLSALYEAKIGDNIKGTWNKFIEFIKSLFGKFMESITKLLFSYKKYLAKYRDIILNKKFKIKLSAPLPGNYVEGTKRCFDTQIPQIQYNDTFMKPLKEGNTYDVLKLIIKNHSFDEGKELTDNLKEYFLGIDVGTIDSLDKLNRADMYNFCYNAEKIESTGNKDITTLNNTTKVIEQAMNEEINKQQNQAPTAEGSISVSGSYFMEADKAGAEAGNSSATNNNNANNNDNKVAQAGHVNTNPIASATSNVTTNDDKLKQQGQDAGKQAANNNDAAKVITDAFNLWRTVCQSVITAKMTAQEAIAKDYMGIIRSHVRSYVGKDSDIKDSEQNQATNYNDNGNNNGNSDNNGNANQEGNDNNNNNKGNKKAGASLGSKIKNAFHKNKK